MIQDPPIISHKGHPWTTRISGANEGAPRGGGPTNTQCKSQRVHRQVAPEETPMNGSSLHLKLSVCTGVVSVGGLAITGTTVIGPEYLSMHSVHNVTSWCHTLSLTQKRGGSNSRRNIVCESSKRVWVNF